MDQFISALGRADHALLIDCRSLEYEQVPLRLEGLALVIADTGVRRELVSSAYNDRRAECEAAVAALAQCRPGIHSLRDVTPDDLERFGSKLPPVLARRVRHVVGENARTVAAAETLRRGDHAEFGRRMNESHASCRDLYEVSCPELEALVAAARATDGTLGSRLTGAGFGGATVSLVRQEALERFRREVADTYRAATGRATEIYICSAADGASEVAIP
jgi:galactokinase